MDEKREFIGSTLFRKRKFRYRFQELLEVLSGTGKSYRDLVLDENGRYSKKKTDALINELLDCIVDIRAYEGIEENFTGGRMIYEKLTAKERSFYKSYFYLILGLGMYTGDCEWSSGGSHEGGTWDALLDAGGMPQGLSMAELDRNILNVSYCIGAAQFRAPEGVFYRLIGAYRHVTGRDFAEILSESEFKAGYELLSEVEKKCVDEPGYAGKVFDEEQKELDEYLSSHPEELTEDDIFDYSERETQEIFEDMAMVVGNADSADRIGDWNVFFEDAERFMSSCKAVHKGMFDPEAHGDLDKEIPEVIEYYLSKNGYSAWMSDEKFFPIYTYLNKVVRASMKMLGED